MAGGWIHTYMIHGLCWNDYDNLKGGGPLWWDGVGQAWFGQSRGGGLIDWEKKGGGYDDEHWRVENRESRVILISYVPPQVILI